MSDRRVVLGPGAARLLRNGEVVAPLAVADTRASRRKGLLGTDAVEGALWITKCPSVHMMGMRYAIDVAVLDRDGKVLTVRTLQPWTGMTFPSPRNKVTVEAGEGSMARWGIRAGDVLAIGRP